MVTRTKKIFVGGLSAPTTLEDVKNYFEQFGPVSTRIGTTFIYNIKMYISTHAVAKLAVANIRRSDRTSLTV